MAAIGETAPSYISDYLSLITYSVRLKRRTADDEQGSDTKSSVSLIALSIGTSEVIETTVFCETI